MDISIFMDPVSVQNTLKLNLSSLEQRFLFVLFPYKALNGLIDILTYVIMASFSKNLIITCFEERLVVRQRRTLPERTLLNIAISTGL